MRIVLLAHFYPPEMGGAGSRLHGLARWLTLFGHDVTVITGFPNYPSGVVPGEYRWKLWKREKLEGVDVLRTWVYASPKGGSLRRLANYFSFVFSSAIAGVLTKGRTDVVVASCPPLFLGLSGWFVSCMRRAKFVFDIRDLWPEVAVEAGEFRENSKLIRMAHGLANWLYTRADHITPVTENKRRKLVEKRVDPNRITVVENGVDLDQICDEVDEELVRKELGLERKFIVIYAGLLGIAQNVEMLIDAARDLAREQSIHILIVGDGVRRPVLQQRIDELNLQNVTFLGQQPKERVSALLLASNLAFVSLSSSNLQDAVPSKLLEAWAHKLPVLLVAGGEAAAIAERENAALVVPPEEAASIASAILDLHSDRSRCKSYGQNGFAFVESNLTREHLARQMEHVLQKVVDEEDNPVECQQRC